MSEVAHKRGSIWLLAGKSLVAGIVVKGLIGIFRSVFRKRQSADLDVRLVQDRCESEANVYRATLTLRNTPIFKIVAKGPCTSGRIQVNIEILQEVESGNVGQVQFQNSEGLLTPAESLAYEQYLSDMAVFDAELNAVGLTEQIESVSSEEDAVENGLQTVPYSESNVIEQTAAV